MYTHTDPDADVDAYAHESADIAVDAVGCRYRYRSIHVHFYIQTPGALYIVTAIRNCVNTGIETAACRYTCASIVVAAHVAAIVAVRTDPFQRRCGPRSVYSYSYTCTYTYRYSNIPQLCVQFRKGHLYR